jgi:hypothetical protein
MMCVISPDKPTIEYMLPHPVPSFILLFLDAAVPLVARSLNMVWYQILFSTVVFSIIVYLANILIFTTQILELATEDKEYYNPKAIGKMRSKWERKIKQAKATIAGDLAYLKFRQQSGKNLVDEDTINNHTQEI